MKILVILSVLLSLPIRIGRGVDPGLAVVESEQRDGYTCSLVEYSVEGGERVRSYLLVPDGVSPSSKAPALVLLHDHGARFDIGKEKLVRPLEGSPDNIVISSRQWVEDNFDGVWFGDYLAGRGYVVIVPDALYWGDRCSPVCRKWSRVRFLGEDGDLKALKEDVYEGQRAVYDSLYARGVVWAEKTLREDAQAVRVLESLRYVDRRRIGAFGWSMGAHRTWLLAAFCRKVKTGVALCWMTLKKLQEPYSASEYSMLIPSMREKYDFWEIARWLRPRPFYFLAGEKDKLFPKEAVEVCYERMQSLYPKGSSLLRTEFIPGPHHCGRDAQERIVSWFDENL